MTKDDALADALHRVASLVHRSVKDVVGGSFKRGQHQCLSSKDSRASKRSMSASDWAAAEGGA